MRLPILILVALALTTPAVAQAPAKPAAPATKKPAPKVAPAGPFDGAYRGVLSPAPALSKRPCSGLKVEDFRIDRGRILFVPGFLAFEGTVTNAGFVSGVVHYAGESKAPLQGRIVEEADGAHLRAGIIDEAGGCAWTMDVKKQ